MRALVIGLLSLFTVSICNAAPIVTAKQKQIKPEITKLMINKGQNLYKRLMKMRKEPEFKQYGFDGFKQSKQHERYEKWMWDGYELQKACTEESQKIENVADRLQSELSDVCIAINFMNQMGQHYARNKGQDDKFTRGVGAEVSSALKIGR